MISDLLPLLSDIYTINVLQIMKKQLLIISLIALFFTNFINAQQATTITTGRIIGTVCKGNTILVPFTANGSFDTGNSFKVQIKGYFFNTWIDLVSEGTKSPLKVVIPNNYALDNFNSPSNHVVRVTATKPNIVGKESDNFPIYTKSDASLMDANVTNVNPFDAALLGFTGGGSTPIKIVLTDSTKFSLGSLTQSVYYNDDSRIFPSKTNKYSIAYTENVCGRNSGKGDVTITVNEIGLKILRPNNSNICVDGVFKIPFSTLGGEKFKTGNVFKIGLRDFDFPKKEYEIDAVEKDGSVEAKIPNTIPSNRKYAFRVVSSSPKAISEWTSEYEAIYVSEKASVEIISPSIAIDWGREIEPKFSFKGIGPWSVTLSDGTTFNYLNNGNDAPKRLKPQDSQKYSITSFSSGCGIGGAGKNVMEVTVNSGVVLDSIQQTEVCVGGIITAKYAVKGNFNPSTFSATLRSGASGRPWFVNALFANGLATVNVPESFYKTVTDTDKDYYIGLTYNGNTTVYSKTSVRIKNKANASIYNSSPKNLTTKGSVYLPLTLSGSGNFSIMFEDSSIYTSLGAKEEFLNNSLWNVSMDVIKTTTFKLKSITNSCNTALINEDKSIIINVKNPAVNDIVIKDYQQRVCGGAKMKVYFGVIGDYKSDNEFRVELLTHSTANPIVIGKGKNSPIEVTLPASPVIGANIRVASSNPTSNSVLTPIDINGKPNAVFFSETQSAFSGEPFRYSIYLKSGIDQNIYTFSNGMYKIDGNLSQNPLTLYQNGSFFLKSVSNGCGVGTVDINSTAVNILPFKIIREVSNNYNNYYFSDSYCTGSNFEYSYSTAGKVDASTTFNLQIASVKDSVFTDLVSKTTQNPISATIPTKLQEGNYFIRLISNTVPRQSSVFEKIVVANPIFATITATDGSNAANNIEAGDFYFLKYNLKGTSPATFTTSDEYGNFYSFKRFYFTDSYSHNVNPIRTSNYTIREIDNVCGYGTSNGSVKLSIKPSLKLQEIQPYATCLGGDYDIESIAYGEFEIGNTFKVSLIDSKNNKYEIGQPATFNGKSKIKIPTNIPVGAYRVEVASSKPAITKTTSNSFSINTIPDIFILGNTTINAGQGTYITMSNLSLKTYPNYVYSYFDGTVPTAILSDNNEISLTQYQSSFFVTPSSTTTYTVKSVENSCGIGKASGSATITVNPKSDKTISTLINKNINPFICSGTNYFIDFETKGVFSTTNKYTAQISDKNGENFKDITSEGDKSPLKVTIPDNLEEGENYRLRIISSDKDATSGSNAYPLNVYKAATATLDSTTYYFAEGKPVNVKINLMGVPVWSIKFGTEELSARIYNVNASPFTIKLNPISPVAYKIFSVSDAYCVGKVNGTGIVRLELITTNEEIPDFEVKIFPNPTADKITIQSDNFKNTSLQITDNLGRQILQQNINKSETVLDISDFKTGQYYLQIERENKRNVYKIQKL